MRLGISVCLLFVVVFLPVKAFSQYVVSGKVTNSDKEILPFATVALQRQVDSLVVKHTTTDNEGRYQITCESEGNYLLQVGYLGYHSTIVPVALSDDKSIVLDVVLSENATNIAGVTVTASNPGVRFASDTIRYDPKVFTDGSEIVLGDVLKKLPGVEVDQKGSVKAHGKQVEGILLNGQDFFSGNTQMATNNLPADIAENVEVLNNYSEYSMLSGFQSHEKTVINVGVANEKLGKISGDVALGGGYQDKYLGRANVMQINSKLMTSFVGALNNTGEEVFSIEDYIRLQGGVNELASGNTTSSIELSNEESALLLPQNNTFKRRNGLGALNLAYQPRESLKLTSYFLFNDNREQAEDFVRYSYLLPEKSFETTERMNGESNNQLYSGFLKLNYQPSETFTLSYKGTVSNIDMARNRSSVNTIGERQIDAYDTHNAQTLKTRHDLLLMKSLGAHLLMANIYLGYSDKPSKYDMRVDSLILPIPFDAEDKWFYGRQAVDQTSVESGIDLSFLYKIDDSYILRSSLGFRLNNRTYRSRIYDTAPSVSPVEQYADNMRNDLESDICDYNAGVSLIKNKGLFRFKVGVLANLYRFRNSDLGSKTKARLNPLAEVSLFFSPKHVLTTSFSTSEVPIGAESFLSGVVFDSWHSFTHTSTVGNHYSTEHRAGLNYRFYDLFSNTMVVATGTYSRTKNKTSNNYIQTGLLTELRPISGLPEEFMTANLFVNKGLGFIPWVAKLSGGYTNTLFGNQSAGVENRISIHSSSGTLSLESNYRRRVVNYELKAGIEYFRNNSSTASGSDFSSAQLVQRYGGKVKLNIGKCLFSHIELEYILNRTPDYNQRLFSLNANLTYEVSNSFELSLTGENMLHMDKQAWVSTSYNGIYLTERYFSQIPGNMMLRLRYKF